MIDFSGIHICITESLCCTEKNEYNITNKLCFNIFFKNMTDISFSIMSSRFTHVVLCVRTSRLKLNNIPLYVHITFFLSIHPLVDTWAAFIFGFLFNASVNRASLVAQMVKHLPAMRETWVRSLGRKDPLEKEMATHSSTLAWKIPWKEDPGRLQSMGSQRVRHDWATSLSFCKHRCQIALCNPIFNSFECQDMCWGERGGQEETGAA